MALALPACALAVPPGRHPALQHAASHDSFEDTLGERSYSWTVCSFDDHHKGATYSYTNLLWPNGYEWARLPKNTHLLLYGKSSMGQLASALRAASEALGVHKQTVTFSAARDCHDASVDPRTRPQSSVCIKGCGRYMTLGPSGKTCGKCREWDAASCAGCYDPHSITVDHLSGGSTITTFANHAQSQRLNARLDEYLSMVAPRKGSMNFTHGAFMDPHSDHWFDERCAGTENEPRAQMRVQARASSGSEEEAEAEAAEEKEEHIDAHLLQSRRTRVKHCNSDDDAQCPRQHPHFATVSRWVEREVSAVLEPPRDEHDNTPFRERLRAGGSAGAKLPNPASSEALRLRCVTDEQLQNGCPGGRNTTVWLGQSKRVYTYSGAAEHLPLSPSGHGPPCYCEHLCNARCARGGRCHAGPGLAAAWLVLRAAGLAGTPS